MKKTTHVTILLVILVSSIVFAFHDSGNTYISITKEQIQQKQDIKFNHGKALFKANCKGCHYEDMIHRSTGPALGGVTKKRDKKWLYAYTRNSLKMFVAGDSLAVAIGNKYPGLMSAFPSLSDYDLDLIYYYVEKRYQMSLQGIPVPIEFEFKMSENNNAKACTHILNDKLDILRVAVSKNRQWTFSCNKHKHKPSDWQKTTLKAMFNYDKSVNEVSALMYDFPAVRTSKTSHWDAEY
jgi:mono/diheme cytochrome c family protein